VQETFRIPKVGTIAGCRVSDGLLKRDSEVRLLRDNVVRLQRQDSFAAPFQGRCVAGDQRDGVRYFDFELWRHQGWGRDRRFVTERIAAEAIK